jgi:hypothetical protein
MRSKRKFSVVYMQRQRHYLAGHLRRNINADGESTNKRKINHHGR